MQLLLRCENKLQYNLEVFSGNPLSVTRLLLVG